MNRYWNTLLFYVIAVAVIWLLKVISPTAQDGGPGLGDLAILALAITVIYLFLLNAVRGFSKHKSFFIIAAIHLLVLIVMAKFVFGIF